MQTYAITKCYISNLLRYVFFSTQCWIDFDATWKWRLYMTLVSITLFVVPALIISACYIVIVITIWRKGKDIRVPATAGECMYNNIGIWALLPSYRSRSLSSIAIIDHFFDRLSLSIYFKKHVID